MQKSLVYTADQLTDRLSWNHKQCLAGCPVATIALSFIYGSTCGDELQALDVVRQRFITCGSGPPQGGLNKFSGEREPLNHWCPNSRSRSTGRPRTDPKSTAKAIGKN